MKKRFFWTALFLIAVVQTNMAQIEKDIIKTNQGDLEIWFVGHGSLIFGFKGQTIHVDPYSKLADYTTLPKADLILITHEHGDHLDQSAIAAIRKPDTRLVTNPSAGEVLNEGTVMKNNESITMVGLTIESVPAYNIVHMRSENSPFHPKGVGNGYIISFGNVRVYIAGDTEDIPEMAHIKNIDVAFLPMNLPYTMTPQMVAKAAKTFNPKILYPYHFGKTNTNELIDLLKDEKDIEVRIRKME